MRIWGAVWWAVLLWLGGTGFARAATTVDQVLACMRANVPKTIQMQELELIARDAAQRERRMRGKSYVRLQDGRLQAMLRLAAPADLAGAAYLLREREEGDEMYLFVPALSRVRRLSGAADNERLWGTDIAYSDLRQLSGGLQSDETRLLAPEALAGRATYRLEVRPVSATMRGAHMQVWVDTESCIALRVDFYEGQTLRRRLRVEPDRLHKVASYWYADRLVLADLQAGTQTQLGVLGVRLDDRVSDRLFSPASFHLGH